MKLEIDGDEIILFLKKDEVGNFNLKKVDEVEEYFRSLLLKLEENYHLQIEGFYNIQAFLDKKEGLVLKLEKEDIDYYHSFHQIEMRITKEDTVFLYEVDDILDFLNKDLEIYQYQNKFYIKNNSTKKVYNLYEFGRIIYENTDVIMKKGSLFTEK